MALFGTPTGVGAPQNLQTGSPQYQDTIVSGAERSLRPRYQQALKSLKQDFSGRGLLDSGLGAQAELGLGEDYLNQLGGVAERAATGAADVSEENRRAAERRAQQVQDREKEIALLKEEAERSREAGSRSQWANLISPLASAAGQGLGFLLAGPAGAAAGGALGQGATNSLRSRYESTVV